MRSRAVFLDRDGVINSVLVRDGKPFPPSSISELKIINGVSEALSLLRNEGFMLIVVTNQPDIARGITKISIVEKIHKIIQCNLNIDEIRMCIHTGHEDCNCRKPKPGMLLDAAKEHQINLSESYMIGDRWRDIDAGYAAGCKTIFIDYDYNERKSSNKPNYVCSSLIEAAFWIVGEKL